jgi:nicotinate-nucleotide adenylyltransferase
MATRVGILGGSFDPIHLGHLHLARALRDRLALDRVVLVPAARQPLKASRVEASAGDRLAMARLAAASEPWLEVSDVEVRRPGPSYTYDTLRALRAGLPPDAELHFLAGADVLADLERWYRLDDVLPLARFAIATRPGHRLEVPPRLAGRVDVVEIEPRALSATEVRARLAAGGDVSGILPPAVSTYIQEKGLYR